MSSLDRAVRSIEQWLLYGGIQLKQGPHKGGVAGWLDAHGRPEFLYLEIAGYYLTTAAWLASGAASSQERVADALENGHLALDWMRLVVGQGTVPSTRLYLSHDRPDWRNAAVFSFDLSMAARGIWCFKSAAGSEAARDLVEGLCGKIGSICSNRVPMKSHTIRSGGSHVPSRWSTRPGPHHLKAAASVLNLPSDAVGEVLTSVCRHTSSHWEAQMREGWPCRELHALLYGLEGMFIGTLASNRQPAELAERLFHRLMLFQAPDGNLPPFTNGARCEARSDVLAQALRIGMLLRDRLALEGDYWDRRLDGLARSLLLHVQPSGAVFFSRGQRVANAWCAMFAHQALCMYRDNLTGVHLRLDPSAVLI